MLESAFVRLRDAARDVAIEMGHDPATIEGCTLCSDAIPPARWITIPFPPAIELEPEDRDIVEAIRQAGKPLTQPEIAKATELAERTVQRRTPDLVKRGVLKRSTKGFYLSSMRVE